MWKTPYMEFRKNWTLINVILMIYSFMLNNKTSRHQKWRLFNIELVRFCGAFRQRKESLSIHQSLASEIYKVLYEISPEVMSKVLNYSKQLLSQRNTLLSQMNTYNMRHLSWYIIALVISVFSTGELAFHSCPKIEKLILIKISETGSQIRKELKKSFTNY